MLTNFLQRLTIFSLLFSSLVMYGGWNPFSSDPLTDEEWQQMLQEANICFSMDAKKVKRVWQKGSAEQRKKILRDCTYCNDRPFIKALLCREYSIREILPIVLEDLDLYEQDTESGNTIFHEVVLGQRGLAKERWVHEGNRSILQQLNRIAQKQQQERNEVTRLINKVNNQKETPLHVAIKHRKSMQINILIELGADLSIQDEEGNTPAHLLAWGRWMDQDKELFDLLRSHPEVRQIKNNEGYTPEELRAKYKAMEAEHEANYRRVISIF